MHKRSSDTHDIRTMGSIKKRPKGLEHAVQLADYDCKIVPLTRFQNPPSHSNAEEEQPENVDCCSSSVFYHFSAARSFELKNDNLSNHSVSEAPASSAHLLSSSSKLKLQSDTLSDSCSSQVVSSTNDCVSLSNSVSLSLTLPEQMLKIEINLANSLLQIHLCPAVSHVYNPIQYAIEPHYQFLQKYCTGYKDVLFLGMNPGPFGMAQTGVPFGDVSSVRDWLCVDGNVGKPVDEHPSRPILGFSCSRTEVSGSRFWKLFQEICVTPEKFFRCCFVYNMCPLLFLSHTGKNLTPADLPSATRKTLNEICERSLCDVIRLLRIRKIVGVGKYAQDCAKHALKTSGVCGVDVSGIMHPSPANPAANKGWSGIAQGQLTDQNLLMYL